MVLTMSDDSIYFGGANSNSNNSNNDESKYSTEDIARQQQNLLQLIAHNLHQNSSQYNPSQHSEHGFKKARPPSPGYINRNMLNNTFGTAQRSQINESNRERMQEVHGASLNENPIFNNYSEINPPPKRGAYAKMPPAQANMYNESTYEQFGNQNYGLRSDTYPSHSLNNDMLSRMLSVRKSQESVEPMPLMNIMNSNEHNNNQVMAYLNQANMNEANDLMSHSAFDVTPQSLSHLEDQREKMIDPFSSSASLGGDMNVPNHLLPNSWRHEKFPFEQNNTFPQNMSYQDSQHLLTGNDHAGHLLNNELPQRIEFPDDSEIGNSFADFALHPQNQHLLEPRALKKRPLEGKMPPDKTKKRKKRKSQRTKPPDMPRRPLSAYNLFFSAERERILKDIEKEERGTTAEESPKEVKEKEEKEKDKVCQALLRPLVPAEKKRRPHRKTHGKISFRNLAQMVGQRWKALDPERRKHYQDLAEKDLMRHKMAMVAYYKRQAEQRTAEEDKASTDADAKAEKAVKAEENESTPEKSSPEKKSTDVDSK